MIKNIMNYVSLKVRFCALFYEGLLLVAVTFVALLLSAVLLFILQQVPNLAVWIVGIVLLLSWYVYFFSAWHKKEQTLAMRTWHIKIKRADGNKATKKQLKLRFIWAVVFLVFIPAIVYLLAKSQLYPPLICLGLALIWWLLPWGWVLFNSKRQFLYDVLAGTVLIKES